MAAMEWKVVQELLDQIVALKKRIETKGDAARKKLKNLNVDQALQKDELVKDGKLDVKAWEGLSEDEQSKLCILITRIRDSLRSLIDDNGPKDPKHIMHNVYASNLAIVVWTFFGLALTFALLFFIYWNWAEATGTKPAKETQEAITRLQSWEEIKKENLLLPSQAELEERRAEEAALEAIIAIRNGGATESSVLLMVILLGALGGSLHYNASFVKYVGNRRLKRSWLIYYWAVPFLGAGLAPVTYLLLRIGVLSPSGITMDGSSVANLNLNGVYAFALLTGLFSKTATDKLNEVFQTVFRTKEPASKDSMDSKPTPDEDSATT